MKALSVNPVPIRHAPKGVATVDVGNHSEFLGYKVI